jgi:hypothetical protein
MYTTKRAAMLAVLVALTAPTAVRAADCSKVVISADSDYAPLHWYDGKRLTGAEHRDRHARLERTQHCLRGPLSDLSSVCSRQPRAAKRPWRRR